MIRGLVSEARPIPWDQLLEFEEIELKKADRWIQAVLEDAKSKKPKANEIDEGRSGRVLLIDGPRGSGKTSVLLTLLKHWGAKAKNVAKDRVPYHKSICVFLPVLDFDPLPPAMPLHGWLLEPWRKKAQQMEHESIPDHRKEGEDGSSYELFVDLFERVVSGWTPTYAKGQSVVEKTLAYEEQASGWIETKSKWNTFVGAMLCRKAKCTESDCRGEHGDVFVIPIDDVDLQVERLPELLHALRLLSHPNVAYVLTGDFKHLEFVMMLDYVDRHTRRVARGGYQPPDEDSVNKIKVHANRLCDAFLEKALPPHARLSLRHCSFTDVLRIANASTAVGELATGVWTSIDQRVRERSIATARQAQHAADRYGSHTAKEPGAALAFIADLCGVHLSNIDGGPAMPAFDIRGKLATRMGPILRAFEGDSLRLVLNKEVLFVLESDSPRPDADKPWMANQALLIHSLVENARGKSESAPAIAVAYMLEWAPDAGIISTHVTWDRPTAADVENIAVFHWPWLFRPSSKQILNLGDIASKINSRLSAFEVNSLDHLDRHPEIVVMWLMSNLDSLSFKKKSDDGQSDVARAAGETSVKAFGLRLQRRHEEAKKLQKAVDQEEIERWAREIYVMTMPYFGLPDQLAEELQAVVKPLCGDGKLEEEQWKIVGNAITADSAVDAAYERPTVGRPKVSRVLSSDELDYLVRQFLLQRKKRRPRKDWIALLDRGRREPNKA